MESQRRRAEEMSEIRKLRLQQHQQVEQTTHIVLHRNQLQSCHIMHKFRLLPSCCVASKGHMLLHCAQLLSTSVILFLHCLKFSCMGNVIVLSCRVGAVFVQLAVYSALKVDT